MIISGGFNVYPSDLEAVLFQHEAVQDAPSSASPRSNGAKPRSLRRARSQAAPNRREQIRLWANERLGKTRRLSALEI